MVYPFSRVNFRNKLTSLPEPVAFAHALIVLPCRFDPAVGRAIVFIWRKVSQARRVTLLSQKGDLARQVTLLVKRTVYFLGKRFASFCKEIDELLARPG